MTNYNGQWKYISDIYKETSGYRVVDLGYNTKPGNYYVETWSQKCPRGCCYDDCIRIIFSANRIIEIKEKIKELAEDLKHAKSININNIKKCGW